MHTKPHKICIQPSGVQPVPAISGWLNPDSLQDVRGWHENIDNDPECRKFLKAVPPEVLKMAIAS
jgi:hypothetical protein